MLQNLKFRATYSKLLLILALVALGASVLLVLAYSLRSEFRVAVGEFGDGPYVSGFNGDEPGAPRYRWTGGSRVTDGQTSAIINFPITQASVSNNRVRLELGAALAKDSGQKTPPLVTVLANGIELGKAQTVEGTVKDFEFAMPAQVKGDSLALELRSPTFKAGGRVLGVKVQNVALLTAPALRFPPFEVWFWAITFAVSAALVAVRSQESGVRSQNGGKVSPRRLFYLFLVLASYFLLLALPYLTPKNITLWYGPSSNTPYLMQVSAWVMLAVCAVVWRDKIGAWLLDFPVRLEEGKLARNILLAFSLLYFGYAFAVIAQMDYVGHADYADNAVVARNFVRGNGLTVDYAAQFYTRYDTLPRPSDTWPLLQPLITAPFFVVLGATAFAAKLPNLILMLALTWAVFRWGSRLFNRKTGLVAALLTLASPALFEAVAYPINDLSFTFFSFLALMNLYRASQYRPIAGAALAEAAPPKTSPIKRLWQWLTYPQQQMWVAAGLWSGLLLWSKPSGGVVLAAAGVWLLEQKFWNKEVRIAWRHIILWVGLTLLIISPYMVRGMLLGGTPLYSTERYDVWTLMYTPWERIYDLYYPNKTPLPEPRLLLNYGFDNVLKIKYNQFRDATRDVLEGKYIAPLLWLAGSVGLIGLSRRRYGLLGLFALSFAVYLLFINLYWHYEIRYFMVWLPWFYLLGAYGLGWLYDKLRQNGEEKHPARLGGWVLAAALAVLILPNLPTILDSSYTGKTGIVTTSEWIKANTTTDSVIMSRNIWEVSFHADRKGVMIPNNITKLEQLRPVLKDYKVKYLQLDHLDINDDVWKERQAMWKLINRETVPGYKLIYDKDGFLVYQILDEG